MDTLTTIPTAQITNFVHEIVNLNLGYLGLGITIILVFGGFFYLFNFKPLQKSIEKQEDRLDNFNEKMDEKLVSLNTVFANLSAEQAAQFKSINDKTIEEINNLKKEILERTEKAGVEFSSLANEAQQEIKNLENKYQESELENLWREHYMWLGLGVHGNTLTSLIKYMEKAILYKKTYLTDLWFDRLDETLEKISSYKYTDKDEVNKNLILILEKIKNSEEKKNKIKDKIKKVFS